MRWCTGVLAVAVTTAGVTGRAVGAERKGVIKIPLGELLKLIPAPGPPRAKPPPYEAGLSSGDITATVETDAHGRPRLGRVTAQYALAVPDDAWRRLPILGTSASLLSATLDGEKATVAIQGTQYTLLTRKAGARTLDLSFAIPVTTARGVSRLRLPLPPSAGATLTVTVPGDQKVTVTPSAGVSRTVADGRTTAVTPLPSSPRTRSDVLVTWERAVTDEAVAPAKVYAEVHRLAAVAERFVRVLAICRFSILRTGVDRFILTVPADVEVVRVTGDRLAGWDVTKADGAQRVAVRLRYRATGDYLLALELERAIAPDGERVIVPTVMAEGVERQSGDVACEAWSNVELTPADARAASLDPRRVSRILRSAATTPIVVAFRPAKPDDEVVLHLRRHAALGGLGAVIDVADFETLVTADGRRLTRVIYAVRNRSAQFLRVRLPENAVLWSASVAGQPVKPAAGRPGEVLFPLAKPTTERRTLEPFPVSFVCFRTGPLLTRKGPDTVRVDLPKAAMPARYASCHLRLPEGYRFEADRFAGPLDRRDVLYEETEVLLRTGLVWDEMGNLQDTPIPPDGTPHPWPDVSADRHGIRDAGRAADQPLELDIDGSLALARKPLVYEPFGVTGRELHPFYSSPFTPTDLKKVKIDPRQSRTELLRNWAKAYGKGTVQKEVYKGLFDETYNLRDASVMPAGRAAQAETRRIRAQEAAQRLRQTIAKAETARQRAVERAAARLVKAREEFENLRAEKIKQLIAQGNAHVRRREYGLAFKVTEEVFKLDPSNVEARILRDQAQMWAMHVRNEELRKKRDQEIRDLIIDVQVTRIPYRDIITYPEDWDKLAERRKKYSVMNLGGRETPVVAQVRRQLAKPVTVEFPGTSFDNVIDFLQDLTGVSIVVDRKAKEAEGITAETTIKLKLTNVRLESALNLILDQVNLGYVIKDQAIFITTREGLGEDPEVRVHNVRDLLVAMGEHGEGPGANGDVDEEPAVVRAPRPAAVDLDIPQVGQLFKFERFLVGDEPLYIEAPYVRRKD